MKTIPILLIGAAILTAGATGWWLHPAPPEPAVSGRQPRFYQSPMHPWIRSDKPGNCTICGMKLVPVYEGDPEFTVKGLTVLGTNSVHVAGIAVARVERRSLNRRLRVAGTIDDDDSQHRILTAYVEGRIEELHVHHSGAEVTAGEPLASFYSPMLLSAVREYLALTLPGGAVAPGLQTAAALRLRQMGLGEKQIAELPQTFTASSLSVPILSPVSGTVVKRIAYAGQYVREGEPLFELGNFDVMWFKFDAYERDLPWLHPGQRIVVTTPSRPGVAFTNVIAFIDPNLDELSHTAHVRVEMSNPPSGTGPDRTRPFRHRLYAEGRVEVVTPETLTVPRTAVLNPDGQPFVWVAVGPGNYERREVVLGRRGDDRWEIVSGAKEGESIVMSGGFLIDAQAQLQHGGDSPDRTDSTAATTPNPDPAKTK